MLKEGLQERAAALNKENQVFLSFWFFKPAQTIALAVRRIIKKILMNHHLLICSRICHHFFLNITGIFELMNCFLEHTQDTGK